MALICHDLQLARMIIPRNSLLQWGRHTSGGRHCVTNSRSSIAFLGSQPIMAQLCIGLKVSYLHTLPGCDSHGFEMPECCRCEVTF